MLFYMVCACAACGAYWFHAGDELGYPGWLGAAVSLALFLTMYWLWPGGLLWALGTQVAAALGIGVFGSVRLNMRR